MICLEGYILQDAIAVVIGEIYMFEGDIVILWRILLFPGLDRLFFDLLHTLYLDLRTKYRRHIHESNPYRFIQTGGCD